MQVVTRSKQEQWSRCHSGERISQSLLTTRPGCREEAGPRSHQEATSGSARYRARHGTQQHSPCNGQGQGQGLNAGARPGAERAQGKAPDEPSHCSSSQASSLL